MNKIVTDLIFSAAILTAFGICTSAQVTPEKPPANPPSAPPVSPCPKLEVRSPTPGPVKDGRQIRFTATLNGGDPKVTPIFIWSTSSGAIVGGQSTANLDVDSTGSGPDKSITASLLIGGFPGECMADANFTVQIAGPAKKVDEFGTLKIEEETARLDSFVSSVTPTDLVYIISYAGRTSPRGQANADLKRIRSYLGGASVPVERIGTIDGGFREEIVHELWLVPMGADAPRPSPTISPKDIVYPKPTPVVKKP